MFLNKIVHLFFFFFGVFNCQIFALFIFKMDLKAEKDFRITGEPDDDQVGNKAHLSDIIIDEDCNASILPLIPDEDDFSYQRAPMPKKNNILGIKNYYDSEGQEKLKVVQSSSRNGNLIAHNLLIWNFPRTSSQ